MGWNAEFDVLGQLPLNQKAILSLLTRQQLSGQEPPLHDSCSMLSVEAYVCTALFQGRSQKNAGSQLHEPGPVHSEASLLHPGHMVQQTNQQCFVFIILFKKVNQPNGADALWPSVCRISGPPRSLSSSLQATYCVGKQEAVCDF